VLFNILAPGVEQVHLSAGLTKKVSSKGEVNLAVTYAPGQTVIGPNPMDPTQTISL
jgi:long-chain fatty acid transport protein